MDNPVDRSQLLADVRVKITQYQDDLLAQFLSEDLTNEQALLEIAQRYGLFQQFKMSLSTPGIKYGLGNI